MALSKSLHQSFCIPEPTLTEKNLYDMTDKVSIITGGYAGVGFELSKILYQHNATIYLAGRSEDKGIAAIKTLKETYPQSKGRLEFLKLDLADLSTIKKSAEDFMSREKRLHVLTNNAGVMVPPQGSVTAQGHELQIGTNCLGPFLFTKLLLPTLEATADEYPPGEVRVTWAASVGIELWAPEHGVDFDANGDVKILDRQKNYGQSKTGNMFIATEFPRRIPQSKVVNLAWNPGNLRTDLQRHMNAIEKATAGLLFHPAVFGAYTELWAGYSKDITPKDSGRYVHPWGRFGDYRKGLQKAVLPESEGGLGRSRKFWDWCEKEVKPFT